MFISVSHFFLPVPMTSAGLFAACRLLWILPHVPHATCTTTCTTCCHMSITLETTGQFVHFSQSKFMESLKMNSIDNPSLCIRCPTLPEAHQFLLCVHTLQCQLTCPRGCHMYCARLGTQLLGLPTQCVIETCGTFRPPNFSGEG